MRKFKLKKMPGILDPHDNDYWYLTDLTNEQEKLLDAMADVLTDSSYHELCHQLNGLKYEFDGPDDGEVHINQFSSNPTKHDQKKYAIYAALYRGIFAKTINLAGQARKNHGYYNEFPFSGQEYLQKLAPKIYNDPDYPKNRNTKYRLR